MLDEQTSNEIATLVRQSGEEPRVAVETSGMSTWPTGEYYYHGVVVVATDTRFLIYNAETKGAFKKKVVIKPGSTFQFNEITSPQQSTDTIKMIKFLHDPQEVTFMNVHDDPSWDQFVQFWGSRLNPSSGDQVSSDRPAGNINKLA